MKYSEIDGTSINQASYITCFQITIGNGSEISAFSKSSITKTQHIIVLQYTTQFKK